MHRGVAVVVSGPRPTAGSELALPDVEGRRDADWLGDAWWALNDRYRDVLTRRLGGQSLAHIGGVYGVSTARVQQLQGSAQRHLLVAQARHAPDLVDQLAVVVGNYAAVPDGAVAALIPTGAGPARHALLRAHGLTLPRTWSGTLVGWWTQHPTRLDLLLRELGALAPVGGEDLVVVAAAIGLPAGLPLTELLDAPRSPLTWHSTGWVRRHHLTRDTAYLWLQAEGKARTVADIALITNTAENTVRERMRRDDAFTQVQGEGTWALAEWDLPGNDTRYATATDIVVGVLRDHGPLTLPQLQLHAEAVTRCALSVVRLRQGLGSTLVGLTTDGRYDLVKAAPPASPASNPPSPRP